MMIIFEKNTLERLRRIEQEEGIPPVELVRQAVEVWSAADAGMRRAISLSVMHAMLQTIPRKGDGGTQ